MPNANTTVHGSADTTFGHANQLAAASAVTPAEDKVLHVLRARPASTVAEIALAAGVGRSTASKTLTAAERRGHAQRSRGSIDQGRRTPDRWTLAQSEKPPRLGRGALRSTVAEFLAAHPDTEFTPTTIGKALNRSSGAITNALTKLAETGQVTQTGDRPLRYAIQLGGQPPCDSANDP